MAKIDNYIIQRVLDATDIVDVVGSFVELRQKGQRWVGLCPFHDDRHVGNFSVYPRKRCYKCFACDAKGDAVKFLMDKEGLSFADAIRWLGKRKGIDVDGQNVNIDIKAYEPPPPLPTLFLPTEMVMARASTNNVLCRWLRGLSWSSQQAERIDKVLEAYKVSTNKWGDVIWWQIDENGGVRDGKMMTYLPDGHRDKANPYSTSWVSRRLFNAGRYDEDQWEVRRCLFGLHLLNEYPNAEINIVESEKTAIICAIYFGDPAKRIWMATAGKSNLTKYLLEPLMKARRTIALHPDKDAVQDWEQRCRDLDYNKAYVNAFATSVMWNPQDGEKADIADVLIRVMDDERRSKTVKKLADIMPKIESAAKTLVERLDLEEKEENDGTDEGNSHKG